MKMTKIFKILMIGTLLLSGCMTKEKVMAENEIVKIELLDINTKENEKTGFTLVQLNTRITNVSDEKLSSVQYRLNVLDKDGEIIKSYTKTYYGENRSLDPNTSVDDYYGFQDRLERKPASFTLEVIETKDIGELPLIHLPLEDEYLYEAIGLYRIKEELPIEVYVRIDHMGALDEAYVRDEETIREFVDRFCIIKIDQETDSFVTDNYNGIGFTFADGSEAWISLNLYNLEISSHGKMHLYQLKELGSLWDMCKVLTSSN